MAVGNPPDPWFFERWAFETTTGNPVRKAVLSMLAMMADAQTGRCEAKVSTIAQGVEAGERTISGHLTALEGQGLIARRPQFRRDRGRRGDEFLLLAPGITEWPDGEHVHPADSAGGAPSSNGTTPPSPNGGAGTTTVNGHASERGGGGAREVKADPRQALPEDFPEALKPHARGVYRELNRVAAQHELPAVTPLAVGRCIMRFDRRPIVATAHELSIWAADPPRAIRNVVQTYATFLERRKDLAAPERVDDDGHLLGVAPGDLPPGVTPLRGRDARDAARAQRAAGDLAAIDRLAGRAEASEG